MNFFFISVVMIWRMGNNTLSKVYKNKQKNELKRAEEKKKEENRTEKDWEKREVERKYSREFLWIVLLRGVELFTALSGKL